MSGRSNRVRLSFNPGPLLLDRVRSTDFFASKAPMCSAQLLNFFFLRARVRRSWNRTECSTPELQARHKNCVTIATLPPNHPLTTVRLGQPSCPTGCVISPKIHDWQCLFPIRFAKKLFDELLASRIIGY